MMAFTRADLQRLPGHIATVLAVLSGISLVLMALSITADVALRYFFNAGIKGTLEFASYYFMVGAIFLSFSYAEIRGESIQVDMFVQKLPRLPQRMLQILCHLIAIVFFAILLWQSLIDALRATSSQETIMANFTFMVWPSRWFLPIGFASCCFAVLSNLVRDICILWARKAER